MKVYIYIFFIIIILFCESISDTIPVVVVVVVVVFPQMFLTVLRVRRIFTFITPEEGSTPLSLFLSQHCRNPVNVLVP